MESATSWYRSVANWADSYKTGFSRAHHNPHMPSAQDVYAHAPHGRYVVGWKLDPRDREALLARWPARYARAVADHVTLKVGVAEDAPVPEEREGLVVGRADDGRGVEALVVSIAGTTDRFDGSTWHITWSLAPGRKAKESNEVIARRGWQAIDPPVPVRLQGLVLT